MKTNTVLIKNAKIVNEGEIFEGDIFIEGEYIKEISNFSSNFLIVVVCGLVLGISTNEVIPPAIAALDSVSIVALCVRPGSLK